MKDQAVILGLFLFTVFAGLAGAVWEWAWISRELKRNSEPQGGPGWDNALRRKLESLARQPGVEEPPRMGVAGALPNRTSM